MSSRCNASRACNILNLETRISLSLSLSLSLLCGGHGSIRLVEEPLISCSGLVKSSRDRNQHDSFNSFKDHFMSFKIEKRKVSLRIWKSGCFATPSVEPGRATATLPLFLCANTARGRSSTDAPARPEQTYLAPIPKSTLASSESGFIPKDDARTIFEGPKRSQKFPQFIPTFPLKLGKVATCGKHSSLFVFEFERYANSAFQETL